MPVPDNNFFTLQDVVDEINPTSDTLDTCFSEATTVLFDPTYIGDEDRLSNFRNYGVGFIIATTPPSNSFDGYGVAAGNGVLVMTRRLGNPARSLDDGDTWTEETAPEIGQQWRGVAFHNNTFCMCSESTTSAQGAARSTDGGQNFIYGTLSNNYQYRSIIPYIPSSVDFFTWGGLGGQDDNMGVSSNDGQTFTQTLKSGDNFFQLASNGSTAIIGVYLNNIMRTVDVGVNLTFPTPPNADNATEIAYGGGVFIVITGAGNIWRSVNDGVTWATVVINNIPSVWTTIAYGNGAFVACANGSAGISTDGGLTWSSIPTEGTTFLRGMTFADDWFVAVGNGSFVQRFHYPGP